LIVTLAVCFVSLAYSLEYGHDHASNDELSTDENKEWEQFKINFMRKYNSSEEEELRRRMFVERLRETLEHNSEFKKGKVSYTKAINKFSDLLPSEVPTCFVPVSNETLRDFEYYQPSHDVLVPREVDWRTRGVVTEVKDQNPCGACWAFATTGVLESQIAIKTGRLVSLSEQNLVDCDHFDTGCNGGDPIKAYQYIMANGIDSEQSYPYERQEGVCRYNRAYVAGTMRGFRPVLPNEQALMVAVAYVGPIAVGIDASDLNSYHQNVYKSFTCSSLIANHAVLVVGYGTTPEGEDYWIVKNSWGKNWGEGGYFRIARNYNMCGIANHASFPIV